MIVAHDFTHYDLTCSKGDELPDDHPLVTLAPHLFIQPEPVEPIDTKPVRIRGPLVEPEQKPRSAAKSK